jgi:hypothetical protein
MQLIGLKLIVKIIIEEGAFYDWISCCWLAFSWITTGNQHVSISVIGTFTVYSVQTEVMLAGQTCTESGNSHKSEC